ncbi:MAG: hypothetical protein NTV08_09010 [Verrucomicrobia bacterium]|nr:hypothetical protein [Verrucomicrobiota bacterium]
MKTCVTTPENIIRYCHSLRAKPLRGKSQGGSTILLVMLIITIVTAAVGVAFVVTNAGQRMGARASAYITAERVADGAVEYGFGIWKQRVFMNNGAITTAAANNAVTAPLPTGFQYDTVANNGPLAFTATDAYGAPSSSPVPTVVSMLNYPGWKGYSFNYLVSAKVKSTNQLGGQVTAGVRRRFQYVEVPIFQMMFFFNDDLVIYKPATMTVGGLVHTNANLYLSQQSGLTFNNNVSYAGSYSATTIPPYGATYSAWSSSDLPPTLNGALTKVPVAAPLGVSMMSLFNTGDTNPNNDGFQEIIQMPNASYTDPPEISQRRMSNKAGIVINISGTTATLTLQNGTVATAAQQTAIKAAFTGKTTLYDQREGKTVDVANIDVSLLTPALNALGAANFNSVLYIVDTTTVSGTSPNPKTVRLKNGGVLPDAGLTIASQNPVYIQGDYNTGTSATALSTTVPANSTGNPLGTDSPTVPGYTRKSSSVLGDAVMFLSNSWNDANSSLSLSSRTASNTTYNTAVLSGFLPSGYTNPSGTQYGYSGGANNFPRFLETWSSKTCTYTGSMVELFQSQTFTGAWGLGNIYAPPTRRWNFDNNFLTSAPPGSLICVVYSRGTWSKF